jgi:hypothetical protein
MLLSLGADPLLRTLPARTSTNFIEAALSTVALRGRTWPARKSEAALQGAALKRSIPAGRLHSMIGYFCKDNTEEILTMSIRLPQSIWTPVNTFSIPCLSLYQSSPGLHNLITRRGSSCDSLRVPPRLSIQAGHSQGCTVRTVLYVHVYLQVEKSANENSTTQQEVRDGAGHEMRPKTCAPLITVATQQGIEKLTLRRLSSRLLSHIDWHH